MTDSTEFCIKIVLAMIGSLFYLRELSDCEAPMHIWILGEWAFLLAIGLGFLIDPLRYRIGSIMAVMMIISFIVWNLLGVVMYTYSLIRTPTCFPSTIAEEMGLFMVTIFICLALGLCFGCKKGIKVFNRYFHQEKETKSTIDRIKSGDFDLEAYLEKEKNTIDSYALFGSEVAVFKEYCTVKHKAPEKEELTADCPICTEVLEDDSSVIRMPVCSHSFHLDCIDRWLKNKSTCPMCRRGVRSNLYRHIQSVHGRGGEKFEVSESNMIEMNSE